MQKLVSTLKGRTLILVERLAHGDALNKLIPGSLWVQGKDNDETRDLVIKHLQESTGKVVAIATQQIFSAAINVFIHNFINAAGGKAEHDIIQRMGRGLRTANDKEILTYYDFIFRTNNYLEEHSRKRVRILKDEGHEIILMDKLDFME
jgi:superfamily II DNA or RNA helicase